MCPFPGAIGWFWMHGAGILPSRAVFRAEGPEIMHGVKMLPALLMHGAKMLPALLGLFVTAACSLVERALCPIAQTWLARRMSAPLRFWSRSPPSHPSSLRSLSCLARLAPRRLRALAMPSAPAIAPCRPCDLRRARHAPHPAAHAASASAMPRAPSPPAAPRPAARAPLRFRQFPRNGAVIQLPIQENFVSKDKQ